MSQHQSFDDYASSYSAEMRDALGRFGGESSYYLRQKVNLLSRELKHAQPRQVLDFGCGIGQAVPFLLEAFSPESLVCTDESKESLNVLREAYPAVRAVGLEEVEDEAFDLIFVANVLHHIEPRLRHDVVRDLCRRLRPQGVVAVFEHNPLNPITRRIVSNCSFDEGVTLLSKSEVTTYFSDIDGVTIMKSGYFLFVPEPLKRFNWIDSHMYKVPFGGQHFTVARQSSEIGNRG
jgi:SAM-dependent methyltransferase